MLSSVYVYMCYEIIDSSAYTCYFEFQGLPDSQIN